MFDFLDGKKTVIAAVILTLTAFLDQVLVGIWGVSWAWVPNAIATGEWIGMILGGAGLVHKAVKANT